MHTIIAPHGRKAFRPGAQWCVNPRETAFRRIIRRTWAPAAVQRAHRCVCTATAQASPAPHRVVILGGYGTFGKLVAERLASSRTADVELVIVGRNGAKARTFADTLPRGEAASLDVSVPTEALAEGLRRLRPDTVLHTCGPFQGADYRVAEACVAIGANYVDLADASDFVSGAAPRLDAAARAAGCLVVCGASTVPGLTSAVVDALAPRFDGVEELEVAICPGGHGPRGVGTVRSVLSYAGRPVVAHGWPAGTRFGWMHTRRMWLHGLPAPSRLVSLVDTPEAAVLPARLPSLRRLAVYAGVEPRSAMLGMWAMAAVRRAGLAVPWEACASALLAGSNWLFDRCTDQGGMWVRLRGPVATAGAPASGGGGGGGGGVPGSVAGMCGVVPQPSASEGGTPPPKPPSHEVTWEIYAGSEDGAQIAATSSVVVIEKLAAGLLDVTGARPCVGLFTLDEFLASLRRYDMQAITNGLGGPADLAGQQQARLVAALAEEAEIQAEAKTEAGATSEPSQPWFAPVGSQAADGPSTLVPPPHEPRLIERGFGEELRGALSEEVRAFHETGGVVRGRLVVGQPSTLLARLGAWVLGLPRAPDGDTVMDVEVATQLDASTGVLHWTRTFTPHSAASSTTPVAQPPPARLQSAWSRVGGLTRESIAGGLVAIGMHLRGVAFPVADLPPPVATHAAVEGAAGGAGPSRGEARRRGQLDADGPTDIDPGSLDAWSAAAERCLQGGAAWLRVDGTVSPQVGSGAAEGDGSADRSPPTRSDGGIAMGFAHDQRSLLLAGVPLPAMLAPVAKGVTLQHADGRGWFVYVRVALPFGLGQTMSYTGHVRVVA